MKKIIYQALCFMVLIFLMSACGGGSSDSEDTQNQTPSVLAGDHQTVTSGDTVNLNAQVSDLDGTISIILWQQIAGEIVELTAYDTLATSFTAPEVSVTETLTFVIVVTDNNNATASDTVNIIVEPADETCQLNISQLANCTLE